MTKEETLKILSMLSAFYGQGKSEPKMMLTAWHLILEKYDYAIASKAVLNFAENDRREYATFPAVGSIVEAIKKETSDQERPLKEIIKAISYGRAYSSLSERAKENISQERYEEWLAIDAEEFANKANELYENLINGRKKLGGV